MIFVPMTLFDSNIVSSLPIELIWHINVDSFFRKTVTSTMNGIKKLNNIWVLLSSFQFIYISTAIINCKPMNDIDMSSLHRIRCWNVDSRKTKNISPVGNCHRSTRKDWHSYSCHRMNQRSCKRMCVCCYRNIIEHWIELAFLQKQQQVG